MYGKTKLMTIVKKSFPDIIAGSRATYNLYCSWKILCKRPSESLYHSAELGPDSPLLQSESQISNGGNVVPGLLWVPTHTVISTLSPSPFPCSLLSMYMSFPAVLTGHWACPPSGRLDSFCLQHSSPTYHMIHDSPPFLSNLSQ